MADSPFTREVIKAISEGRNVIRGLPNPEADIDSLYNAVMGLKEAVETLMRSRNDPGESAVRVKELEPIFGVIEFLINDKISNLETGAGVTSHNDLTDVTADQHHPRIHSLFSADHDDIDLATARNPGDILVWSGSQYIHQPPDSAIDPTFTTDIAPTSSSQVASFESTQVRGVKYLLSAEDLTTGDVRTSELMVSSNGSEACWTHYAKTGDVLLYKPTASMAGSTVEVFVTNNDVNSLRVGITQISSA